jgi:hypothetical protein
MSSQTSMRYDGHPSSKPNILFRNSFLEFSGLRGRNLYMWPRREEQQDSATSILRVVVMILLAQLLFIKAF